MSSPHPDSNQTSYDQALTAWNLHLLRAKEDGCQPNPRFFPVTPDRDLLVRIGMALGMTAGIIAFTHDRLEVYAALYRRGWQGTARERAHHRGIRAELPELWKASEQLLIRYLDLYRSQCSNTTTLSPPLSRYTIPIPS